MWLGIHGDVAMTLDASYYKGVGSRGGHEREVVYKVDDAICIDNHPNDSRVTLREDNIVQSLTSRCGTGGGNVPLVMIVKK